MDKRKNSFIKYLALIFVISLSLIDVAYADQTIKLDHKYNITPFYGRQDQRFVSDKGGALYCWNIDELAPAKGAKMTCKDTFSSPKNPGGILYIMNKKLDYDTNKAYLIRQIAIWYYQGELTGSGYDGYHGQVFHDHPTVSPAKEGIALGKEALNNKNYTVNPSITLTKKPTTTFNQDGNYYLTSAITPTLKNITGNYKVTVTGLTGAKPVNTSGSAQSSFKQSESFKVKVPAASINASTKITIKVTGTGIKKTLQRCDSADSKEQEMGLVKTTNPEAKTTTTFTVEPTWLKVKKVKTGTTKALSGAVYKLYSNNSCTGTALKTATTGTDGVATFTGIKTGTYYVKETTPPKGYKSTPKCKPAKTGNTTPLKFENEPTTIIVFKVDKNDNKKFLKDAQFKVYTDRGCTKAATSHTGNKIIDYTDENGKVTFYGLVEGKYYVKEEEAPDGYEHDEKNCREVSTNKSVTFENVKLNPGEIKVYKKDKYSTENIDGVTIGIYSDNKCENSAETTDNKNLKETKNGYVKFNVINLDGEHKNYWVKEQKIPDGYLSGNEKSEPECIKVNGSEGSYSTTKIYNIPYGDIKLLKSEQKSDKPIKKIKFKLLDENKKEVKDIHGNIVKEQETDEEGFIEFKDLKYGDYYIKEIYTNKKYKEITDEIKLTLNERTDAKNLEKNNVRKYQLGDINMDELINDKDVSIYSELIENPDTYAGLSSIEKFILDINGHQKAENPEENIKEDLEVLNTYLKYVDKTGGEKNAKAYYEAMNNLYEMMGSEHIDVKHLEILKEMHENNKDVYDKYVEQCIEESAVPLADVQDKIDCEDEIDVAENACDKHKYELKGDFNGDCSVNNDDIDEMRKKINGELSESQTKAGDLNGNEIIDEDDIKILSEYVQFENDENESVIFNQINTVIIDRKKLCGEDDNCDINLSYLKNAYENVGAEIEIPENIAKSSLVVYNELIEIIISKQSITSAKEVPGAKITIKDENGDVVKEFTSGKVTTKFNIEAGTYTLIEEVAPKGFSKLETKIKFKVESSGNVKLISAKSNMYKITNYKDTSVANQLIVYNKLIEEVKVPPTASNKNILVIVLGVIIGIVGCYFVYDKYYKNKEVSE